MLTGLPYGYWVGLSTDLAQGVALLQTKIQAAQTHFVAYEADLKALLTQHATVLAQIAVCEQQVAQHAGLLAEYNAGYAAAQRELALLKNRLDSLAATMQQLPQENPAWDKVRRSHGQVLAAINKEQVLATKLLEQAESTRQKLRVAEQDLWQINQTKAQQAQQLAISRKHLPELGWIFGLLTQQLQQAHCLFVLDADSHRWQATMQELIAAYRAAHADMQHGYSTEQMTGFVAGRLALTGDMLSAAVVLGDFSTAQVLFAEVTHEQPRLHAVWPVFRVWSLGLWLQNKLQDLTEWVLLYRYSTDVQGLYANSFLSLINHHHDDFLANLQALLKANQRLDKAHGEPALQVVPLDVLALCRLALAQGFSKNELAKFLPTLPLVLLP